MRFRSALLRTCKILHFTAKLSIAAALMGHHSSCDLRKICCHSILCVPVLAMQSLAALVSSAVAELLLLVRLVKMVPQHLQEAVPQSPCTC